MKAMEHGKRVESDMVLITQKYKMLAEKAGFDFWDFGYQFWPDHKINTKWSCSLGFKNTTHLAGQGFASTPHQAYLNALKKANKGEE